MMETLHIGTEASCKNMTEEKDKLKTELDNFDDKNQTGSHENEVC